MIKYEFLASSFVLLQTVTSYKCEMTNWHRYMDRRPRCSNEGDRRVCNCQEFYVWPYGTYGRKVKIAFPSHFDRWDDDGFPVVFNYHGTNMDPITTFSSTKVGDIEHYYIKDKKVKITEQLLDQGFAVVSPSGNEVLSAWE